MSTTIPADWPASLTRTLQRLATAQPVVARPGADAGAGTASAPDTADPASAIRSIESLSGMSGSSVHRVVLGHGAEATGMDTPTRTVIVKRCVSGVEPAFYRSIAPHLEAFGLGIPRLLAGIVVNTTPVAANADAPADPALTSATATQWLILEAIPHPLAAMDPDDLRAPMTHYLARLHAVTRHLLPQVQAAAADLPQTTHAWSDAHTAAALAALQPADTAPGDGDLGGILRRMQQAAQPLFEPWCRVSGDTNARNWGLREDGTVVLFDWEQTGSATPAFDLGSTLPGLPDLAAFRVLADDYLAAWRALPRDPAIQPLPWDAETMARLALLARVTTLVHLLTEMSDPDSGTEIPANLQTYLHSTAPDWLRQTARDLGVANE